ncbi:arabinan endo-1,5-alpha-L-arabinosidase [Acidicapsa dinghuensis]|uniref:Arabinan endo-1,5-alpha-L-arabinosidase n=1 Tax=Acidicapsa dinghuensis TaxID=2218256 RepID=A0ABW1EGB4_9BACT|nr:arabinan endo-1,5-alpha-L-arabinosidase [Acidicapsa dinghuensis]
MSFWIAVLISLIPQQAALHSPDPRALSLSGDYVGVHDPSIGRDGDNYYVFATSRAPDGGQFAIRCSHNLTEWELCGHVFDSIPEWIQKTSPGTKNLWAPDISFFHGKYHLYYAYSLFGRNLSGIALATNQTLDQTSPEYRWQDKGLVLQSTTSDDFNAIDPNIVLDEKGMPWLSFGSFWSGIKMRRIDPTTGKLDATDSKLYSLAARQRPQYPQPQKSGLPADWQAIEAPFIVRHGGFYYLFVSFDLCCRGTHSTYRTMVGRSRTVTGPYVDREGREMAQGGGSELLTANSRWLGPGGESVLLRPEGDLIVFHAYDAATGKPALQISTLAWRNGWPEAALGMTGEAK